MVVIGLTGGIASGKSTVSRILREMGAVVIDSDLVAKEVVRPRSDAWRELVREFGRGILNGDGTINRRRLGGIVFSDRAALEKLNRATHPRIVDNIRERLEELRRGREAGVVVIEAPLLFEAGMDSIVEQVWVVKVDPGAQVERLMARDHFTFQEALNRLGAQMPLEEKVKRAHVVIDNDGPVKSTRRQIERLWAGLEVKGWGDGA